MSHYTIGTVFKKYMASSCVVLAVVGCSPRPLDVACRDRPHVDVELCRNALTCVVQIANTSDATATFWDMFSPEWATPRDGSPYGFFIRAELTDGEIVTENEDTTDGWWNLSSFSSTLLVPPVHMSSLPPHASIQRRVDLLRMIQSAYEYRHHVAPAGDLGGRVFSVAVRCRVVVSSDLKNSIQVERSWVVHGPSGERTYHPYPDWRKSHSATTQATQVGR